MHRPGLAKLQVDRPSRASSTSSEVASPSMSSPAFTTPQVKPSPAYVAVAAASQLVTDAHLFALLSSENPPANPGPQDNALFSEGALFHINAFLDHLLYKFLSTAHSSSLKLLRQAVEQVLKGRLGRLAVASADAELAELLAEGEDEELGLEEDEAARWNTDLYFRRTRLRIMVYMRLGEMEDEDEEEYLAEFGDVAQDSEQGEDSHDQGLVSWAGAIFLTSILELVAEECLKVAGQAAFKRTQAKRAVQPAGVDTPSDNVQQRVTVIESDVDKAGIDSRLGRLWRSWKHKLRLPYQDHTRNFPSPRSSMASRGASVSTIQSDAYSPLAQKKQQAVGEEAEQHAVEDAAEDEHAAVDPQEVSDEARERSERLARLSRRPLSLVGLPDAKSWNLREAPASDDERRIRQRSRPQTLPSPGSWQHEQARLVGLQFQSAKEVDNGPEASFPRNIHVSDLAKEDEALTTPSTAPTSNALSTDQPHESTTAANPTTGDVDGQLNNAYSEHSKLNPEADGTDQDQSTGDKSVNSSAAMTPVIDHDSSRRSSSRTSIEDDSRPVSMAFPPGTHGITVPPSIDTSNNPPKSMQVVPPPPASVDTHYSTARSSPTTPTSGAAASTFIPAYARYGDNVTPPDAAGDKGWFRRNSKHSKSPSLKNFRKPSQDTISSREAREKELRDEIAGKHFSSYIAGKETLKYTLTPRQLQNIEKGDFPSPRSEETPTYENGVTDVAYGTAQAATPVKAYPPSPFLPDQSSTKSMLSTRSGVPLSRPSETNLKPSKKGFIPREPRVVTASMTDFAEYIRMTGPSSSGSAVKSPEAARSIPRVNLSRRTSMELEKRPMPKTAASYESISPLPVFPSRSPKAPLQPREPTSSIRSQNADLIEFLRSGPPSTLPSRSPAPPSLTTSPYSRQTDGWNTSRSNPLITPSSQASMTPHSLPPRQQQQTQVAPQPVTQDGPFPPRRQYRNNDPYALPSDDEDDDFMPIQKPQRKEESFIDFLRNVEPPPSSLRPLGDNQGPARYNKPEDLPDLNSPWAHKGISSRSYVEHGPDDLSNTVKPKKSSGKKFWKVL